MPQPTSRIERLREQVWMVPWMFKLIFSGRIEGQPGKITSIELQATKEEPDFLKFIREKFKGLGALGIEIEDVNELVIAPGRKTQFWLEFFGADYSLVKDPDEAMAVIAININDKGYAYSVETEIA